MYIYIYIIYIPISFGSIMIHMIINCWWKVHPSRPETWCVFLQCCKTLLPKTMLKIASALGFCPTFFQWLNPQKKSPYSSPNRLEREGPPGHPQHHHHASSASSGSGSATSKASKTFTPPKRGPFQPLSSWWFQPIWKILVKLEIFPSRVENEKYLKAPPSYFSVTC